jgi:hypothetical protein
VMRIPCSTAILRAASLAPGRKAVTRGEGRHLSSSCR